MQARDTSKTRVTAGDTPHPKNSYTYVLRKLQTAKLRRNVAAMQPCNSRNPAPIQVNWPVVETLLAERGITTDAAFARLAQTHQSTITRARRGELGPHGMVAIRRAFPGVPLEGPDGLFVFPDEPTDQAAAA